mgnify:FL=1
METEISPQTAWQNEGICYRYAEDKLNDCVLRSIYMAIVRRSFGYGKKSTNRISQEELAKASAITSRTLRDKLKILEEMKMVVVIPPDTYIKGGGSASCAYAPDFPRGYGKLCFKDDIKKSSSSGSKKQEPEKWSSENLTF